MSNNEDCDHSSQDPLDPDEFQSRIEAAQNALIKASSDVERAELVRSRRLARLHRWNDRLDRYAKRHPFQTFAGSLALFGTEASAAALYAYRGDNTAAGVYLGFTILAGSSVKSTYHSLRNRHQHTDETEDESGSYELLYVPGEWLDKPEDL